MFIHTILVEYIRLLTGSILENLYAFLCLQMFFSPCLSYDIYCVREKIIGRVSCLGKIKIKSVRLSTTELFLRYLVCGVISSPSFFSWVYMKSFIAKRVKSILVNFRYLISKLLKYKENNKKICDTFGHNFRYIPLYV